MSRSLPHPCLRLVSLLLMAAAACGSHCPGQTSEAPPPPAKIKVKIKTQAQAPASGPAKRLLRWDEVEKKIQALSQVPVTGCTPGDLTINGLARLANTHLEKAGRSERVLLEAEVDMDVETLLKANFFSPLYQSKDSLDKADLVSQINAGSLNDLLMSLPMVLNLSMRWFEDAYVCTGATPSVDPVLIHRHTPKAYQIRGLKAAARP